MTLAPAAPAAPASDETRRRPVWKPLAAAGLGGAVLLATGYGVFASLEATAFNTTPQQVSTGNLSLTLTDNGAGFKDVIENVAPKDTVNRYVTLKNNGTLAAKGLTVKLAASGSSALITDGVDPVKTQALRVTISSCSVAWVPTTGDCTGARNTIISNASFASLAAPVSLSTAVQAAAAETHLQISLALPDQTETVVNGQKPTAEDQKSIQNKSAALTWTFTEVQRDGVTTTS